VGILHEDQFALFILSRSVMLRKRNVADKICKENRGVVVVVLVVGPISTTAMKAYCTLTPH
jgi:hypothetical protein